MIGNSDEGKQDNPLRLRRGEGGASDGSGKCISCGAAMPADDVICVRCGFDKRSAHHIKTEWGAPRARRGERRGGFLWAFLLLLLRIALLSAIGYGLYEGYEYYRAIPQASETSSRTCRACRGQGMATCRTCGGFGTIEAASRAKCTQCDGTGKYVLMSKKTTTSCSFCRGKGYTESIGRVTCKTCNGKGWVKCPRCAGSGKVR
jgi:hypothetical protein